MSDIHARLSHQDAPADTLVIGFEGTEALSQPFDFRVDFATSDPDLDVVAWLWSSATVEIYDLHADGPARAFHGVIEEAAFLGAEAASDATDGRVAVYRLRLRPLIHGLHYRVRTRIFQDQSVLDLMTTTFTDSGIASDSYEVRAQGTHAPVEYQVQWRESELAHVRRRLEKAGIFFYFEHDVAGHRAVFVDQPFTPEPIEGDAMLPVFGRTTLSSHEHASAVYGLTFRTEITHDSYISRDWDYRQPEEPRQAELGDDGRFPRYEFPGGFVDLPVGALLARAHMNEYLGRRYRLDGSSTNRYLRPGRYMSLYGSVPAFLDDDYLIEEVTHSFAWHGLAEGADSSHRYAASFVARKKSEPWFPRRSTPVPQITGLESAVVTGPAGEEIHVDEMGRVKVHFYWDRENPVDDTASCWMRVQQMNTSGSMILPRLGWELWIAFLNGDPDRPVAFFKAYNRETMPPYELPANKTQSSLQSSTSPGGGSTNEIRMQDSGGGMDWSMNASKDLKANVQNDYSETIGVNSSEVVSAMSNVGVGGVDDVSIGGNQAVSVVGIGAVDTAGSKDVSVGATDDWGSTGNFSITCDGARDESIGALMNVVCNSGNETIKGGHERTVGAVQALTAATAIAETVGGSKSETVSAAKAVIISNNHEESVKGLKTLNSGLVKIDAGKDVTYGAVGAITINSAGVIKIDASDDVLVSGTVVSVIGPGGVDIKGGGGKLKLSGTTVTVDASKFGGAGGPQLEVKGPIDYNT